ncbi:MAG: Hsp20/alpha crystallin family protein [Deltaproteobacteria bacterium]|nr:Hsp20/alpha crystallin family protein [Deltaproteobacteria bacterium]
MNLTRWNPSQELDEMQKLMSRFFGRWPEYERTPGDENMTRSDWMPAVDVASTPEEYCVTAELPGMKKEDIKVRVKDGVLSITGERHQEKEEKGKRFHRVERYYGSFLRSFTLPEDINEQKLVAEFKDGLLSVRVPRAEVQKPKAIEVKVG